MHGRQNAKICTAKQAKQVYLYKTIKTKFCKLMQPSGSTKHVGSNN